MRNALGSSLCSQVWHLPPSRRAFPKDLERWQDKNRAKNGKEKKIKTEVKERLSREGKRSKEAAGMGFGRRWEKRGFREFQEGIPPSHSFKGILQLRDFHKGIPPSEISKRILELRDIHEGIPYLKMGFGALKLWKITGRLRGNDGKIEGKSWENWWEITGKLISLTKL